MITLRAADPSDLAPPPLGRAAARRRVRPNDDWGWEVELGRRPPWRERLGFEFVERRQFGEDDCFVYQLTRSRWEGD